LGNPPMITAERHQTYKRVLKIRSNLG